MFCIYILHCFIHIWQREESTKTASVRSSASRTVPPFLLCLTCTGFNLKGHSEIFQELQSASMNLRDQSEVEERPQKSLNEKQQEYQDLLIRCVAQHLGLSKGRPVAACIIYKCLRQWRSFEVERTSIFDRIIQTIGHAIEVLLAKFNASRNANLYSYIRELLRTCVTFVN